MSVEIYVAIFAIFSRTGVRFKGNRLDLMSNAVIPAKAGIQCMLVYQGTKVVWIPAFAGMTMVGSKRLRSSRLSDCRIYLITH